MRTQSKTSRIPKARENMGDQVVIGFDFASDWLREWCEFSGPIIGRTKARTKQSRISFETQLKSLFFNIEATSASSI